MGGAKKEVLKGVKERSDSSKGVGTGWTFCQLDTSVTATGSVPVSPGQRPETLISSLLPWPLPPPQDFSLNSAVLNFLLLGSCLHVWFPKMQFCHRPWGSHRDCPPPFSLVPPSRDLSHFGNRVPLMWMIPTLPLLNLLWLQSDAQLGRTPGSPLTDF